MKKSFITVLFGCALLAVLLSGCRTATLPPENTTEPPAPSYPEFCTVRFQAEGLTLSVQLVEAGSSPAVPEVNMEGYVFSHWVDEDDHRTKPETEAISGDRVFTAVMYPDLSSHAPYLFADENGFLHPEGLLTGQDLDRALKALAVREAALKNISVDTEAAALTAEDLQTVLEKCFPAGDVAGILAEYDQGSVTRNAFARMMNALLDRGGPAAVSQPQSIPRDLDLCADYAPAVLEAVIRHTPEEDGAPIETAVMLMPWQPGFTNLGGRLYYADEEGRLLMDGTLGTLTFSSKGYYTCGDEELDRLVMQKIAEFIAADPNADRETLLLAAFEYTRDSFNYVNRGLMDAGATGWETEKAKQMFDKGSGNCYNYAAVFWALARNLGYDAVCCSGNALSNAGPHAWVEIEMDGEPYIFDPQLAWRETTGERTNWGEDMFKIPERLWHQWRYIHP